MRTNLSCCLGLIDNGQYKSTNRLLVVVPHERPHGIMSILKNLCMLLPKALKMRAIKDTMALVADSIGGTKGLKGIMMLIIRASMGAQNVWAYACLAFSLSAGPALLTEHHQKIDVVHFLLLLLHQQMDN